MFRRCILLLALWQALAGCHSTGVTPMGDTVFELEPDERRLWARSREEQARLDQSDFRLRLPEVEVYIDAVLARLHPDPLTGGARLKAKVLIDPSLNAFALPDGVIYLHTGILACMENEAQLATVIGHELTHTTHRHALKGLRDVKNKTAVLATLGAASTGFGYAGSAASLFGALGTAAAISGYARDLEREADINGLNLLIAAGYEPHESVKVFEVMLAEARRTKTKEPFFFSSHPRLQERIASFQDLIDRLPARPPAGRVDREAFTAVLFPVLAANAEAALRAGNYGSAIACAERCLQARPGDARLMFVLAETHRKRATGEDAARAEKIFRQLTGERPDFTDSYRSLGLMLLKDGRKSEAADCFRRYLQLEPAARDRRYVEDFLQQCEPTATTSS